MTPLMKALLFKELDRVRPPVPFDLRPQTLDGSPVLFIDQRRNEIEAQYARLDDWHSTARLLAIHPTT